MDIDRVIGLKLHRGARPAKKTLFQPKGEVYPNDFNIIS